MYRRTENFEENLEKETNIIYNWRLERSISEYNGWTATKSETFWNIVSYSQVKKWIILVYTKKKQCWSVKKNVKVFKFIDLGACF